MKRRDFLQHAALIGGAAALTPLSGAANTSGGAKPPSYGTLVVNGLDPSVLSRIYVDMQRAAGIDCWHLSMDKLRSFADVHNFVDANTDVIEVVRSVREIRAAKQEGKLALLLGWQDANPLSGLRDGENDWWSDPRRSELRAYYEMGLRICGIAYQVANAFGGGAIDGHMGLSRAGRALVEEIHKLRIVLDVGGHTGDRASLDALEMSSGVPIIASHANTRKFANSRRNLSDEVIDGIARTDGVIGIVAISDFVMRGKEMAHVEPSPLGTVDDMLKHADYLKQRIGARHVGMGPDFTHGMSLQRDISVFGSEAMDKGPRRYVKGFESVTELPNVVEGLRRHGWTPEEIHGFLGGNWLRVYEKVWGA
jgi:membrane dipeptidase